MCLMSYPEIILYFESLPANNSLSTETNHISSETKPVVPQGEQRLVAT